jgi:DNA-binding NarL/FixJ family response regulator
MPSMRTEEGIQVAERLRQSDPEVGVVVLSQYSEPACVLKLLGPPGPKRSG